MDFHRLLRRDLQFLCKKNKIPANMTNIAMADALKSLEIVEGLDEYMNQSKSNALQSPTSVAKQPPTTATRTTRRKTTTKAESQSSSQLISRSSHMADKSLAGEMDQENINKNVPEEPKTNNVRFEASVVKTPAVRSTRKASGAASCTSKVQKSKEDELVQSVYSTRRSTRLLEKCMADLSLKTKETLDYNKPENNEETEEKVSEQEKNPDGSEERSEDAEVIPGRDLSASMEKEWEMLKNDSDQVIGGLDLGDVSVIDANTETNKVKMNEVMSDEKESESSLIQIDKQEETMQANKAICEESLKKNDNGQEIEDSAIYVDLGDVAVADANNETNKEKTDEVMSNEEESENSSVQVDKQEETLQANKACEESLKKNDNGQEIEDIEIYVDLGDIPVLEYANDDNRAFDHQEIEDEIQENEFEPEEINNFDQETMVDQTDADLEENSGVDSDGTISEAESNKAVLGSDIADEEMILSETEGSSAAPISPPLVEEAAKVKTTPMSPPFEAELVSVQFPRPNKSTTPSKLVKVDDKNKENNMEMMMMISVNGESKGESKKNKKKVEIDEESLKDVSMRQLVKMVKALSIKSSNNRTALQILPGNNQIAE